MRIIKLFALAAAIGIPLCTFANLCDGWRCQEPCLTWEVDASYIYWRASQRHMDVGGAHAPVGDVIQYQVAYQPFKYRSGFKVGVGARSNCCFALNAEYTWLHTITNGFFTAIPGATWEVDDFFLNQFPITGPTISSRWKMNFDMLDVLGSVPFCVGRRVRFTPALGLRAFWINQSLHIATGPSFSDLTSHNWALGPLLAGLGKVDLCWGFFLDGNIGAALVFTEFTKVGTKDMPAAGAPLDQGFIHNFKTVSPTMNTGLGLGWCTKFGCGSLKIAVRYEVLYLWDQNTLREINATFFNIARPIGNLNLQGLTVSGCFSF